MLENMTTGEKALIGATAIGIAALVFHKPTRSAVGLSDRVKSMKNKKYQVYKSAKKPSYTVEYSVPSGEKGIWHQSYDYNTILKKYNKEKANIKDQENKINSKIDLILFKWNGNKKTRLK